MINDRGANLLLSLALLCIGLTTNLAIADTFNKRNILPGTKAASMGGAFTAIADDASATWYNPGGLGFTKGNDVAISANGFSQTSRVVEEAVSGQDSRQNSSHVYPSFAGGILGLGPIKLGYSYFTLDKHRINEYQKFQIPQKGSTSAYEYQRQFQSEEELLYAGAAVGVQVSKSWSVGVGGFYYQRTQNAILGESLVYESGPSIDVSTRQSTNNEGYTINPGILYRGTHTSVGITARFPKRQSDRTSQDVNQVLYSGSTVTRESTRQTLRGANELVVNEYSLGIASVLFQGMTVAADGTYYPKPAGGSFDEDIELKTSWNVSAGLELSGSRFGCRLGLFTNNSLIGKPTSERVNQTSSVDYVGTSGGLFIKGKTFESMLGLVTQVGLGTAQLINDDPSLHRIKESNLTLILASKYSL
jgi:hypothetical protein